MVPEDWIAAQRAAFGRAVAEFGPQPLVLSHNDADGLSSAALLVRALHRAGHPAAHRILGRGEGAWTPETTTEVQGRAPGGLVVADLGTRGGAVAPGVPTVVIDHHVPTGTPDGTLVSGYGQDPVPTSSLLSFWCAGALGATDDLLWLAAIGILGDLGDKAPFPELADARKQCGITALRDAVSLLNAPRRTGAGDATPAMALLMKAEGPRDITSGTHPETAALRAAQEEVKRELEQAKRVPPKVQGKVALIRFHSPCQVHPLVAQAWRTRLRGNIVIAANTGFRPGWVHFAARSATGENLVAFLRTVRPDGADENYGNGHEQATGGALRPDSWNSFVRTLGFGPEMQVAA